MSTQKEEMPNQYEQLFFNVSVTFNRYTYMSINTPSSPNMPHIAQKGCSEGLYSFHHWKYSKPYWRKSWTMRCDLTAEPPLGSRLHQRLPKFSSNLDYIVILCPSPNTVYVFFFITFYIAYLTNCLWLI